MGWGLKIGLFILATVAAIFGAWIITVPILAILIIPPLMTGRRDSKKPGQSAGPTARSHGWPLTKLGGAGLIVASIFAFFSGGVFSPIVLGIAGLAVIFRPRFSSGISTRAKPVEDSILLRRTLLPFQWSSVAEVKVSTRDVGGALSGVKERILFVSDPTLRIFLVFSTKSFSRTKAEEAIVGRIRSIARALSSLGVYLLPLESKEAAGATRIQSEEIEFPAQDLRQTLSTADYGALAAEADNGFVTKLDLYARPDQELKPKSLLASSKESSGGLLTLRELIGEALKRIGTLQPDRYATFLSSMAATGGETLGQRIKDVTAESQESIVQVSALSSPKVGLHEAQLRAIVRIYQ